MNYKTACPKCNKDGELYVYAFKATCHIPLGADGFAWGDGNRHDSEDERVICIGCNKTFDLSDLTED